MTRTQYDVSFLVSTHKYSCKKKASCNMQDNVKFKFYTVHKIRKSVTVHFWPVHFWLRLHMSGTVPRPVAYLRWAGSTGTKPPQKNCLTYPSPPPQNPKYATALASLYEFDLIVIQA